MCAFTFLVAYLFGPAQERVPIKSKKKKVPLKRILRVLLFILMGVP